MFNLLCQYLDEEDFQVRQRIKQSIANEWHLRNPRGVDVDTDEIMRQLNEKYKKGLSRHMIARYKKIGR